MVRRIDVGSSQWYLIIKDNKNKKNFLASIYQRKFCYTLNRIRTTHGNSKDPFCKWGLIDSPRCDYNTVAQTIHRIVFNCPLRAYDGDRMDFIEVCHHAIH